MRALNPRELKLAIITGFLLLAGISYTLLRNQIQNLNNLEAKEIAARVERKRQLEILDQRPQLLEQLQSIKGQLPRHQEGQDLNSEFARQVQALANESNLRLTGLTPEPEEYFEDLDLYQSSVRCTWSGSSENLVTFLVTLNQQGPVADIRELRLRNRNGQSETLSGTFLMDFVYSRVPVPDPIPVIDTSSDSSDTIPDP